MSEIEPIVPKIIASKESDEEKRRRARAERFGTEYRRTPATLKFRFKDELTVYHNKTGGFSCEGFDASAEEARRAERAQRFNIDERAKEDLVAREKYAAELAAERRQVESKLAEKQTRAERFGIDIIRDAAEEKLAREERAKRFGIEDASKTRGVVTQQRQAKPIEWPDSVKRRDDVLTLYGTGTMQNRDVFQYFQEFGPSSVTWLHDDAVNVFFADAYSARRALDALAVEFFPGAEMMTVEHDNDKQEVEQNEQDDCNENVGERFWRAQPYRRSPLLIRYATVNDVKEKLAPLKQKQSNWVRNGASWRRKSMKSSKRRDNDDLRRQVHNQFNQNRKNKE